MALFPPAGAVAETALRVAIWMPTKHMGNLLVSLRAIESLVRHFGAANCTLITDPRYRHLIESCDLRCMVIDFPRAAIASSRRGAPAHLWAFMQAVWRLKSDLAIALEGDRISQRLIPLSRARRTLGPDNRFCRRFDNRIVLNHNQRHRFYDYAAIARAVTGAALEPGYPTLMASRDNKDDLNAVLSQLGVQRDHPLCILHPGATKSYKQWPARYFADLADSLHARGYQIVATGAGERDGAAISQLQRAAKAPLVNLHNRVSLAGLVALCQRAALYVGNDTGPTHLAAATGTRTLAIFGPTDECRWGPLGDNVQIVRHHLPCLPDCRRGRCSAAHRCINTLTATGVDALIGESA